MAVTDWRSDKGAASRFGFPGLSEGVTKVETALQFSLRKLSEEATEVRVTASRLRRHRGVGVDYLPDESTAKQFLKALESIGTDKAANTLRPAAVVDDSARGGAFSDSDWNTLADLLDGYRATGFVPQFELYDKGIRLEREDGGSTLSLTIHLVEPLDTEQPIGDGQIAVALQEKLLSRLAFAMDQSLPRLAEVNKVRFRVAFRAYALDDRSPLDIGYRDLRVTLPALELIQAVREEISSGKALKNASVDLDGKVLETARLQPVSSP
jgi:hypothetical protein